jgi:hypothetical protein
MRGRYPSGPEYVEQLEGSAQAKQRLRVVLETMTGKYRVQEACQLLDICEQRFHQLRAELLQAALEQLEAKPAGRPRSQPVPVEAEAVRDRLADMELELRVAQVREEIALALPHVAVRPSGEQAGAQKKRPALRKRRARPGWWKK